MPASPYRSLSDEELEAKYQETGERNRRLVGDRYISHLDYDEWKEFKRTAAEGEAMKQEMAKRRRSRHRAEAYYNEYQLGGMKTTDSKRMREEYKRNNPNYRERRGR